MSRKHTAESVEKEARSHNPKLSLDHSTFKNSGSKCRWIEAGVGEFYAKADHVRRGLILHHPSIRSDIRKAKCVEKYGVPTPLLNPESIEKGRKNNLEKYGVEDIRSSTFLKEKRARSNLEKYGVENVYASEEIKTKIRQNNLKKYGTEHAPAADVIKDKIRQTNVDRYGSHYMSTEEFRARSEETCLRKYGVRSAFQSKEVQVKNHQARVANGTMFKDDTSRKLSKRLRTRMSDAVVGRAKMGSAVHDLGCTIDELKLHLEYKFQPGMSWDNYGHNGWHIDHIIPLCSFDLTDPEQFKKACHYTNLQPLWAKDNLEKSSKIPKYKSPIS